jgi:hypothetical protein
MKSADEYAELAEKQVRWAWKQESDRRGPIAVAQVFATLAQAAATLEAARLTLDAQAANLLSALKEPEPDVLTPTSGHVCVPSCDHLGIGE